MDSLEGQFPAFPRVACRVLGCSELRKGTELVCEQCWARLAARQVAIEEARTLRELLIAMQEALEYLLAGRRRELQVKPDVDDRSVT